MPNTLWSNDDIRKIFKASDSGMREEVLLDRYGKPGSPCPICKAPNKYLPYSEEKASYVVAGFNKDGILHPKLCVACSRSELGKKYIAVADKFWELSKTKGDSIETLKLAMKEVGFEYEVEYAKTN